MDKKSLYENASMAVQRYLLFTVLAFETAAAHLTASAYLYLAQTGVKGLALTISFFGALGVFIFMVAMNLGSMAACVRFIWFEKDDRGFGPFARLTLPCVFGQTALSATVWLLYPSYALQFTIGSVALLLGGIFYGLLRRSAARMPPPPADPQDGGSNG